jgi:hypothetical protein
MVSPILRNTGGDLKKGATMDLNVRFDFDDDTYRHRMNGFLSVLHCHHYLCLTTRMAIQFKGIGGIEILRSTAEDTLYPLLQEYVTENNITAPEARLDVGAQYYAIMGMGKMKATLNRKGGAVKLIRSHIDQGWLKKWGRADGHLNHFTCGYIAAMFSVASGAPPRSFGVREVESIVSGSKSSTFEVTRNTV